MRFSRFLFALLGGALLMVGPYFPATTYVSGGPSQECWSQSHFDDDTGGSLLIMVLGAVVVLFALAGSVRALRWASAVAAVLAAASVVLEWTPSQVVKALARGFAPGSLDTGIRLGNGPTTFPAWGLGLFLAAVLLLAIASWIREEPSTPIHLAHAASA